MILRNHGLLVVGRTVPAAFNVLFRLERACQVQVMALSCNTKLIYPPQDILKTPMRGCSEARPRRPYRRPRLAGAVAQARSDRSVLSELRVHRFVKSAAFAPTLGAACL